MNTNEILKECGRLTGVAVHEKGEYTELVLSSDSGNGRMRFIRLFDGVTLAVIEVHAASWPAPVPEETTSEATGPLIINYCVRGRCELMLNDKRNVFLTSGQISLTEKFARRQYVYPGGLYEGIELFIDPEAVRKGVGVLREHFGLHVEELGRRYCSNGGTYVARLPLPESLLKKLYRFPNPESALSKVDMKTGVIDLLAMLLCEQLSDEEEKLVYYTRFQVGIARQSEAIISEDLSRSHTIQEFSKRFSVSESCIKSYFSGMFGQSISRYTKYKRMLCAAKLLAETDLPVIEVSGRVGYESQSKFAVAFRSEHGMTPLEYRKKSRLENYRLSEKIKA